MKSIADALVYAVAYIECHGGEEQDENNMDEDLKALESIGAELQRATEEEKDALAQAATRAYEAEAAGPGRENFLEIYGMWMEAFFSGEWEGNERL